MRGTSRCGWSGWGWILAVLLVGCPVLAWGQGREIHGENSSFAGEGVAMAWGILKAPVEDQSQVVIRIVSPGAVYASVSIEGVDPFTQNRQEILPGRPLGDGQSVRTSRGSFAEFPRREIHLFTAADWQAKRPTLTIYYLGVPDTTPEFLSESALSEYLDAALAKLRGGAQGSMP